MFRTPVGDSLVISLSPRGSTVTLIEKFPAASFTPEWRVWGVGKRSMPSIEYDSTEFFGFPFSNTTNMFDIGLSVSGTFVREPSSYTAAAGVRVAFSAFHKETLLPVSLKSTTSSRLLCVPLTTQYQTVPSSWTRFFQ